MRFMARRGPLSGLPSDGDERARSWISRRRFLSESSGAADWNLGLSTGLPESIIVLNFIQRRTGISRSRTMKILSELKKGGYIHIDNGRLTALGKLPVAY